MLIRRATPDDVDTIRDLVRAAYARWVPIIGREPIPMRADYAHAVAHHMIDLHHEDGALAALIEMHPRTDHLYIVNVAVAPAHQGHGLGMALLRHADAVAGSLGLGELRLFTNKLMLANLRLYLHCGYRVTHEEPLMVGIVLHMSKRL